MSSSFSTNPSSMRLLCPAKINLHLRVGPCRADGFHPLLSWMCTVGLFDTLTLNLARAQTQSGPLSSGERITVSSKKPPPYPPPEYREREKSDAPAIHAPVLSGHEIPAETGSPAPVRLDVPGKLRIDLECEPAGLACDDSNLVVRVAKAWQSDDAELPGGAIDARLTKRTPIGAGLGGGSSDAARMVLALNRLFPSRGGARSTGQLSAFSARFGSDVPFFLAGPSSVCRGRGEIVRSIDKPRPRWAVLVLPNVMMPTPDVYRRFDAMGLGRLEDIEREPDWPRWATLNALSLLPLLVNDLELPAFDIRPELGELRSEMERVAGRPVRMSGSGSSLFTLFDQEHEARAAAHTLSEIRSSKARIEAVELAPIFQDDLKEDVVVPNVVI